MRVLLHRIKQLATQCVGPPQIPSKHSAPVAHRRCRKVQSKLCFFLSWHRLLGRRYRSADKSLGTGTERERLITRNSLQELFVSPPPPPPLEGSSEDRLMSRGRAVPAGHRGGCSGGGSRRFRFRSAGLRSRLVKAAWRPVLFSIPE